MESIKTGTLALGTLATIITIPYFVWKQMRATYEKLQDELNETALFEKRHNCVVTFQSSNGVVGWPPHHRICIKKNYDIEKLYEPILYFIETAKLSLDVAVMLVNVKVILNEFIKAKRRGVRIRLILNFHHAQSSMQDIRKLLAEGIEIQFYISPSGDLDSIMHYKYMIKDFRQDHGYVCTGSLNFSASAFLHNYEDFAFIANGAVAECFYNNFNECWENIKIDNNSFINKTLLREHNLLK